LTPGVGATGAALAWTIGQAAVAVLAAFLTRHLLGWREQRRPALRTLVDHHASEAP
jgi:hypothetical protein